MNRSRADLFAMQDRIPERSTKQKLADYRALRADQIRLARSWRNSPVIRDGHLKAARMLQADIMQLHAVELATALEPGPDEVAEIAALLEPEANAELRQGQHMTSVERLIAAGCLDANGNLKPYKASGHKSTPMTIEELGDDGQQYPY